MTNVKVGISRKSNSNHTIKNNKIIRVDMKIWIKEYNETFRKKVEIWLKENFIIESLPELYSAEVKSTDIVICSVNDRILETDKFSAKIVIFETVFDKLLVSVSQELRYNYDYYYLKNAIKNAKQRHVETIFTGSSYGLFGINTDMLSREVNLSLQSQDLYYSSQCVYEVCRENHNIKNIVLLCGPYYLYSDLSLTKNEGELTRIAKVYYPLFNDLHNCSVLPPRQYYLFESNIFDVNKIIEVYFQSNQDYFDESQSREVLQTRVWQNVEKEWMDLSDEEKWEAGRIRAEQHNKAKAHKNTFVENIALLRELNKYCQENGISISVVITPATKYYRAKLVCHF